MKILFTASECVPFIKTGGLADVVGALAPVLAKKGHDVRVVLPMYTLIEQQWQQKMEFLLDFEVQLGWRRQYCGIKRLQKDGVTYYFIDNNYYFGRPYVYGLGGDEYERYGYFCRAVLEMLPKIDFFPDILHAHDWQSGMIPALLKLQYQDKPKYQAIKTVFTIHNLQYQGVFGINEVKDVLELEDSVWTPEKLECYGCANYMKAGLVYSDIINTVSPSYAEEITTAHYGERLDGLIRSRRESVYGVLNGIDIEDYNPEIDPQIAKNYSLQDLSGKAEDKLDLQRALGLKEKADTPLICMVGRLSNQKGLDLVDCVLAELMKQDVQLAVLGMGDARYTNLFSRAEEDYSGKVAARFAMDHTLAHKMYAGGDFFLMPSLFEPCGLSQMIAMRYGTVPIVRETGGLRDTVFNYSGATGEGNGFTFQNYNADDMLKTILSALEVYRGQRDVMKLLQKRGMEGDYSWSHSANAYVALYQKLTDAE